MDLLKKINSKAKTDFNTGFGTNASSYGGRFVNKDGSANIQKRGLPFLQRISWYHTMLAMPRWKFLFVLFAFYTGVNFVFACIYYGIGVEYLDGIETTGSEWVKFGKAYFFSAQTFTTVGYGHISPNGFLTSALAATEALIGLLSFAIATGLFFGRFSKPTAFLKFSHNALIAPYGDGGTALMLRMTPYKNTNFTDAEAKVTLGMIIEEQGKKVNKFYTLDLELSKINSLTLSWTLVHPVTAESPLAGLSHEELIQRRAEIIVILKGIDEGYMQQVIARHPVRYDEMVWGGRFQRPFSARNGTMHLDLAKLSDFNGVEAPERLPVI